MVRTPARGLPRGRAAEGAQDILARDHADRPITVEKDGIMLSRDAPLRVEALFAERDFNCLPVSEEGALGALLIGIIAREDVLRALRHAARRSRCSVSR